MKTYGIDDCFFGFVSRFCQNLIIRHVQLGLKLVRLVVIYLGRRLYDGIFREYKVSSLKVPSVQVFYVTIRH